MVRLLYILGVFMLSVAAALLSTCLHQWHADDPQLDQLRNQPSAVQLFADGALGGRGEAVKRTSPLVAEARAFASRVSATPSVKDERSRAPQVPSRSRPTPTVRARASLVAFKLHGTSVYPDRPERSMALISEPGGSEGERKWVRQGAALGHFVVQEIRRGVVVLSDGDAVREMTVEPSPGRRSLVRSYTASVARADAGGPPESLEADSNAVAEPATR